MSVRCVPLEWPEAWVNAGNFRRLLRGMPFVGPEHRVLRQIYERLNARDPRYLELWGVGERLRVARTVSPIIKEWMGWPNDLFLPEDPCEILFWDSTAYGLDSLKLEGMTDEMEAALGVNIPDDEWESAGALRFGQWVDRLLRDE